MSNQPLRNRNSEPIKKSIISDIKDKRKSDVLIAAKSLDHEIQNVTNLKRLSIGSMDLLIDPELEFTVNNNNSNNNNLPNEGFVDEKRKSWSQAKFDMQMMSKNNTNRERIDDGNSAMLNSSEFDADEDNSIEATGIEYLSQDNSSSFSSSLVSNSYTNTKQQNNSTNNNLVLLNSLGESNDNRVISNRKLTGVGSLKRGSHNIYRSTRKPSSQNNLIPTNDKDHSTNHTTTNNNNNNKRITNNLLWVPASQHPHVKPQNYLELVQDTLQNFNLDSDTAEPADDNIQINDQSLNSDVNKSLRRHSSIVKRPSLLRRSYNGSEHDNKNDPSTSYNNSINEDSNINSRNKRSVSLKDITEELTRISNSVGLTDDDAITLARTLSMTGSYTNLDLSYDSEHLQSNPYHTASSTNDENEFASNMLMKNGISIPSRSSLRRSKFNTYKIKETNSSDLSGKISHSKSNLSSGNLDRRKQLPFLYSSKKINDADHDTNNQVIDSNNTESPGSISDLYDHYRHSSGDWDMNSTTSQPQDEEYQETQTSQDTTINSQDTSNDSVLYRPTQGQQLVSERFIDTTKEQQRNERPWSWIDVESTSSNLQNLEDDKESIEEKDDKSYSNNDHPDFINLKMTPKKKPSEKSNHSKNRHLPIFNLNLHPERKDESNTNEITYNETNRFESNKHNISNGFSSNDPLQNNNNNNNSTTTTSNNNIIVDMNKRDGIKKSLLSINRNEITETRKETLEEKFVKLFKRKHHSSNKTSGSSSIKGFSSRSQTQDELKKKISKFRSRNRRDPDNNVSNDKTYSNTEKNVNMINTERTSHELNRYRTADNSIPNQPYVSEQSKSNDTLQKSSYNGGRIEEEEENKEDEVSTLPALQPAVSVTSSKQTNISDSFISLQRENTTTNNTNQVVETVCELDGDESQELSNSELHLQENNITTNVDSNNSQFKEDDKNGNKSFVDSSENEVPNILPPRKLTFADVKRPERPNAPIQFTDSAFGFPLPMLTVSTVIMFDHRLGINVERAIYRLSHLKLSDPKRELRQQVLLSNFMYAYLNLVNHTLYMEQANVNNVGNMNQQRAMGSFNERSNMERNTNMYGNVYTTEQNESNESIIIPDIS